MPGTFQSLRVRNFRLFVIGQLLSGTGTWMQGVAAPWLVLQLTGSGVALGFDTSLQFLPILLFGAWGGLVADRFDNRRIQLVTQVCYAVVAATLFGLVATHVVQLWMVYTLSFLSGCVTAIDMPTRQSFYLEMVGPDDLTNAMSLNTATFTGARIIGPAIAGVLIGVFGTAPVFLINAISYLAVVVALVSMRVGDLHPRERAARAAGQIREGVRYVWRTPELRLPMALMAIVFLCAFNFMVFLSLFGVGSLVGALVMASRARQPDSRRLARLGVVLGAIAVGLALAPSLGVAWLLLPPLGAAGIAFAVAANSTLQLTSTPQMRGRVMSLYTVVFLGSTPLGGPVAGWVGEHLGPRVGLAGGGVIAVAASAFALRVLQRVRSPARVLPSQLRYNDA